MSHIDGKVPEEENNSGNSNQDVSPAKNPSLFGLRHLRVFYVRIHHKTDQLRPRMKFNEEKKLPFDEEEALVPTEGLGPFIYRLRLTLQMSNEQLFVLHNNHEKSGCKYNLEMHNAKSWTSAWSHDEKGDRKHSLEGYFDKGYCFMFGVRFSSKFKSHVPGRICCESTIEISTLIYLGLDISVFSELCLFTCYLLKLREAHIFDILVDQFKTALSENNRSLDANEFRDFFERCNQYLYPKIETSSDKVTILKITLRMIGVLSITKEDFDRNQNYSITFANKVMPCVRKNFVDLCRSVETQEWILFQKGLAMLLCIEILQYKPDDRSRKHDVTFLQIIPDMQRRAVADELIDRLHKLDYTIFGDPNWTDLFTITDPKKININQLNVINSFEVLIIALTKISQALEDCSTFEENIDTYLENRVLPCCIEGKVINLLILTFYRIFCSQSGKYFIFTEILTPKATRTPFSNKACVIGCPNVDSM